MENDMQPNLRKWFFHVHTRFSSVGWDFETFAKGLEFARQGWARVRSATPRRCRSIRASLPTSALMPRAPAAASIRLSSAKPVECAPEAGYIRSGNDVLVPVGRPRGGDGPRICRFDNPRHTGYILAFGIGRLAGRIRVRWDNGWTEVVWADEVAL
jgi:hypothetical protein